MILGKSLGPREILESLYSKAALGKTLGPKETLVLGSRKNLRKVLAPIET